MIYQGKLLNVIACLWKGMLVLLPVMGLSISLSLAQEKNIQLFKGKLITFPYQDTVEIDSLIQAGTLKRAHLDFDGALYISKVALFKSKQMLYPFGMAQAFFGLGLIYNDQEKFLQAKSYFQEALRYYQYLVGEYPVLWSKVNLCLGQVNAELGFSDSSIHFYQQVLDFWNKRDIQDTVVLYTVYSMLGNSFMDKSMFDKAIFYDRIAAELAFKIKDSLNLAMIYSNLGVLYQQENRIDSALHFSNKAIQLVRRGGYNGTYPVIPNSYCSMAVLYFNNNNFRLGMQYFDSAVAADRSGAEYNAVLQQYLGWGNLRTGKYQLARKHLEKAVFLNNKSGSTRKNMYVYQHLADAYYNLGDKDLAVKMLRNYLKVREEFLDEEKINSINRLEVTNRIIEKDKALLQQQLLLKDREGKIRDQNLWIIVLSISGIFLVIVLLSRYRNKRRVAVEQERNQEQQKEIERLHSRMEGASEERERIARELHDGVHVLLSAARMTFSSLGKENKDLPDAVTYKDGMQLLQEVGQEVRSITYQLVPELLLRQSLPAALQALCELIQKGTGISISIQSFGSFKHLNTQYSFTFYRILQELLHNIVKHAQATEVLVQVMLREGMLHLTVEDNGTGFETEKTYAGMGLSNLKLRVAQWNGSLFFNSEPGMGTTVEIEFIVDGLTTTNNPTDNDNSGTD